MFLAMNMGTAAYGIIAGLSIGIGVFFLALSVRRGWMLSVELLVGLLSLTAAAQTMATLGLHTSASTEEYAAVLHGPFSYLGLTVLVIVTWTVGLRTGLWYPRVPLALTGFAMIAAALNALTPGSLIVDDVTGLREVHLFGEAFVVHTPGPSSLAPLLLGFLAAITAYVAIALLSRRRRGGGGTVDMLMVGVAVAWAVNLYDVLVDAAVVDTTYLAPFGLVALVVFLAVETADMIVTTERRLTNQSTQLEDVVATRTAALHAAHDDLVNQLDIQNKSALRLAHLSQLFLVLNRVNVDDDVEEVLTDALGRLGELVDAADARLTWQQSRSVDDAGAVKRVLWNRPGVEPTTTEERAVIDRSLRSGAVGVGRLVVTGGGRRFSDEQRRLVDLTAQYFGGLLLRLQLESSRMDSAIDDERHRIARELHDSLSQRLYAAAFNAEVVSLSARTDPESTAREATKIRALVLSTLAEMRTLLFELQPEVLTNRRLTELVAQLCTSVTEIYQQPVGLVVVNDEGGVPTKPKLALYRIAQEAVGNALRHSEASQIGVTVDVGVDRVSVEVVDDGAGFDPDDDLAGHGLRNMRERATEVGAGLTVISSPGAGTTARVIWRRRRDSTIDLTDEPSMESAG
jgi:signal transduction histidine kinase